MTERVPTQTLLKRDLFGSIRRIDAPGGCGCRHLVERNTRDAHWSLGLASRWLAGREARALGALHRIGGVPRLIAWDGERLQRSWIEGQPMHHARPGDRAYYRESLRLLRRVHAAGVVHNDLAKEPNWLVTPDGLPALIDFQLASRPQYRGRRFRALAYDDLRHLLKHKRSYCPDALTARQRAILARRSWPAEIWMHTGKPVYRLVTRRLLGWSDREGAGDRSA